MTELQLPSTDWLKHRTTSTPRGVMAVFHGLNLAPHCMDPLCDAVRQWGIESYRVSLRGHGRNHPTPSGSQTREKARLAAFKEVDAALWLQEARTAYKAAAARASELNVPLYLMGFSLGGLLSSLVLSETSEGGDLPLPNGVILLAPAIVIKPFSNLLHLLRPMSKLVLPSGSPAPYRANWGTSMAAYKALLDLNGGIKRRLFDHVRSSVPVQILVHPRDEFISQRQLKHFVRERDLHLWQIHTLDKQPTYKPCPWHLIVDEASMGRTPWQEMLGHMKSFLAA